MMRNWELEKSDKISEFFVTFNYWRSFTLIYNKIFTGICKGVKKILGKNIE